MPIVLRFHEEIRKIFYTPLCYQFSTIVVSLCVSVFLIVTVSFIISTIFLTSYGFGLL